MVESDMAKTTLCPPDDVAASYEAFAKQDACPKAEIMRDALDVYAENRGRRLPEAVGIFEDLGVDSTNVDGWLRANWRLDDRLLQEHRSD